MMSSHLLRKGYMLLIGKAPITCKSKPIKSKPINRAHYKYAAACASYGKKRTAEHQTALKWRIKARLKSRAWGASR